MVLRIKSILVSGGIFIWLHFVAIGLLFILSFASINIETYIFPDTNIKSYILCGCIICLLIRPINFGKYLSYNQHIFFLITGWIPYYDSLFKIFYKESLSFSYYLFWISSGIAIANFKYWKVSYKIILIIILILLILSGIYG